MDTHIYDLGIRVLIYQEGGEWCAHALELDLLGCGKSEREAKKNLLEAIGTQLSFSRFENNEGLLPSKAPQQYFDRWEKAQEAQIKNKFTSDTSAGLKFRAVMVSISKKLARRSKVRFERAENACA